MHRLISWTAIIALVALAVMGVAEDASAQRRGGSSGSTPPPSSGHSEYKDGIDLSASYGWMWGGHIDVYNVPNGSGGFTSGAVRWASNPSYMFAVEVPVRPGTQLQLQYTGQPSQLNYDPNNGPETKIADMSVNYWQIGTVAGLPKGRVLPYVMFTLGATYWSFSNFTDANFKPDNMTKFSFTAGVGAKTFFGENQKLGIRLQFRVLPTFYNSFATVGTGGVGISGNAVWQWEVGGGLVLKFGK